MGAAFYVIRRSAGDSEYYDEEYEDYEDTRNRFDEIQIVLQSTYFVENTLSCL